MTQTAFQFGPGIGDALWHLASIKSTFGGRANVVVQRHPQLYPDASDIFRRCTWVQCTETTQAIEAFTVPLFPGTKLELNPEADFDFKEANVSARRPYTVVQPSTQRYKNQTLPVEVVAAEQNVVLLGDGSDRALQAYPCMHDWRGVFTLILSLQSVAYASKVVSVESWVGLAGALFGIPTTMYISRYTENRAGGLMRELMPTLTTVVVE